MGAGLFTIGAGCAYLAAFVLAETQSGGLIGGWRAYASLADEVSLAAMVFAIPTAVSWATAEFIHVFWPRRAFLLRGGVAGLGVRGAIAAGLAISLAGVCTVFLSESVPEMLMTAALAALTTGAVLLLTTRRVRVGECLGCRYDIRHSIAFGRCPECGTQIRV